MYVNPKQKTTKLHTNLTFRVIHLQGMLGYPNTQEGLNFSYHEDRILHDKYTGLPFHRKTRYFIKKVPGEDGWRIDEVPTYGPIEAVYGLEEGRPSHWPTNEAAAQALVGVLDEIRDNSSTVRI